MAGPSPLSAFLSLTPDAALKRAADGKTRFYFRGLEPCSSARAGADPPPAPAALRACAAGGHRHLRVDVVGEKLVAKHLGAFLWGFVRVPPG